MNNESIINNLDRDKIAIANTIVNLTYQGYLVNKCKYNKLFINTLITQLIERVNILTESQINNLTSIITNYNIK